MELTLYDTPRARSARSRRSIPRGGCMCGPTVYDFAHIGNARPVIVFDVLFRLLRHLYGADHVTYVRNITDVDDKINARAAQDYPDLPLNEAIRIVTEQTERQFHEDVAALGCLRPTLEPRNRAHRGDEGADRASRRRGQRLCRRGSRAVQRGRDEGLRATIEAFARRDDRGIARRGRALQARPHGLRAVEALEAGRAGVAVAGGHRDAGPSGLAHRVLGDGVAAPRRNLRHPRRRNRSRVSAHENEIAQSRCSFNTPVMANYWMHNGFAGRRREDGQSAGNFFTIRDCSPIGMARCCASTCERTIANRSIGRKAAGAKLGDVGGLVELAVPASPPVISPTVLAALTDDLNTPKAIAELHVIQRLVTQDGPYAVELAQNLAFLALIAQASSLGKQ